MNGGGAETQSQLLANEISKVGIESFFFCMRLEGHQMLRPDNIYEYQRTSKYDVGVFSQLHQLVATIKPDVIHAWLPAAVTIPAMLIGALRRVPVVFSYRNKMFFHRPVSYPEYLVALFCCRKIISNNQVEQSALPFRWLYRIKNGATIYNAVSVSARKQFLNGNCKRLQRLIFVGRLTSQKNLSFVVNALVALRDRDDWRLDIYGVGELEDELRRLVCSLQLDSKIVFRGFCKDISAEMRDADMLLFPSKYEGMPNVLVEGLASGVPVLASDISASRDVVKNIDCVQWFTQDDKASFCNGLVRYLDAPDDFQHRVEEGVRLSRSFTVAAMAAKYEAEYWSLL
jgi:glycosyltransferase involved in cell wall biosynthesis